MDKNEILPLALTVVRDKIAQGIWRSCKDFLTVSNKNPLSLAATKSDMQPKDTG